MHFKVYRSHKHSLPEIRTTRGFSLDTVHLGFALPAEPGHGCILLPDPFLTLGLTGHSGQKIHCYMTPTVVVRNKEASPGRVSNIIDHYTKLSIYRLSNFLLSRKYVLVLADISLVSPEVLFLQ